MKHLIKIPLLLLSLIGFTSCANATSISSSTSVSFDYTSIPNAPFSNEVEYPADDYEYHLWTNVGPYTFLSSTGNRLIAEYKSKQQIELYNLVEDSPDSEGYYHYYLSIPYAEDEKPTFPEKGTINCPNNQTADLLLVNNIGVYTNYHKYLYSPSLHVVKEKISIFEPIGIANPESMVNKIIIDLFLNNRGELWMGINPPYSNVKKIEPHLETSYYKVPNDYKVTFNNPLD